MEEYNITIIQDEAVAMAAKPTLIVSSMQWVWAVAIITILVGLICYLILCRRKEKKVLKLISELGNDFVGYCRLNYFKLRAVERELQYLILDEGESESTLGNKKRKRE